MRGRAWLAVIECWDDPWLADIEDREGYGVQSDPSAIEDARAVCGRCPVVAECLADALAHDRGGTGMRGALTPEERKTRRPARREEAAEPVQPVQPRTDGGKWSEGRILDDATRRDIIALTHDGLTASQIADRLGVRLRSVTYVRATQPLSGPSWTEREVRVAALRSGPEPLPIRAVAATLGLSRGVVSRTDLRLRSLSVPPQRCESEGVSSGGHAPDLRD